MYNNPFANTKIYNLICTKQVGHKSARKITTRTALGASATRRSHERRKFVGRVRRRDAAQVERRRRHSRADAAARLPRVGHLRQIQVLRGRRRRRRRPHGVRSVGDVRHEAVVVVADVRVVQLGGGDDPVKRGVGLLVLVQSELLHGVRLLLLPDEHVVDHRATAEYYPQTYEDAGHYRRGRVELDERVQDYS